MTDESSPEDQQRVQELTVVLSQAIVGSSLAHAQMAIANVIARICLTGRENPDRVFLHTLDTCMEIFRELSNQKLRNQSSDFS